MIITRTWAMPSSQTFKIKPIKELIERYWKPEFYSIDPFANSNELSSVTNDIDPQYDTDYHLDALDFIHRFGNDSVDFVFYDPPYSTRQVSEVYRSLGKSVNMQTTQASYWSNQKKEIGRVVKKDGLVL